MEESVKAHLKMSCVIEASKLKQNPTTAKKLEDKSVVELAKELQEFVIGK